MARLLDQHGRPIDTKALTREEATPSLTGVRQVLSDHPSRGLTPPRLAAILLEAEEGDATRYLELAEDMEEKDLNYMAQLGTRKRAVAQLDITVEAASDSAEDVRSADLVREFLRRDELEEVLVDILDAVGKGYSVCEILWETSERQWMPRDIVWRDPRWFQFDREDGVTLRLREGAELRPLTPFKYIVHVHKAKSGLPIRGGLARAAGWAYLFKNFTIKDWVAFAEIYGQPYRVGKYHPSATESDKSKLLQAVASIGSDAAAIIPEGMLIEFIEAARTGAVDLYQKLAEYLDAQVTKAILGQTLTSDVSSRGGSRALGDVHDRVRRDIMRSDARQLASTLNRALVRPIVDLNLGPQKAYPRLRIGLPDELTTMQKLQALHRLVPVGLDVEVSQVRDLIGFTEPATGAAVLRAPAAGAAAAGLPPATQAARKAAHAAAAGDGDLVDELARQALEDSGWEPLVDGAVDPIRQLLEEATSLEEVRDRLAELVRQMDVDRLAELLARNAFVARIAGDLELDRLPE